MSKNLAGPDTNGYPENRRHGSLAYSREIHGTARATMKAGTIWSVTNPDAGMHMHIALRD